MLIVHTPFDVFKFVSKGNSYACNVREHLCYVDVVTTTDNKAKYTKCEVDMSRQARELTQILGYPSSKDLITLIHSSSIINCPIYGVARVIDIYGPDIFRRTKRSKSTPAKVQYISKSLSNRIDKFIDLTFVEGDMFLCFSSQLQSHLVLP
jgi:hypothetical protein